MADYLTELTKAIRATHGVEAKHVETIPVCEYFQNSVAWQGDVEVFNITGHPKAKRCFAWGYKEKRNLEITAVLELPPVTSPETAVRVAIAAHARQAAARRSGRS